MTTHPPHHGLRGLAWLLIGILQASAFVAAIFPPLPVTVVILAALSAIGLISLHVVKLSIMCRLFVLLYSLPFAASLGYLFDSEYIWARSTNVQPLCQIHDLINPMLAMAIVGLCGMMAGIETTAGFLRRFQPSAMRSERVDPPPSLSLPVVVVLLGVSIFLSWLHAPTETIFEAAYTGKVETALKGAWLISYLILIFLYVDFERDPPGCHRARLKLLGLTATVAYIVIVLQILRGDRECAGLVTGLVMLYVTRPEVGADQAETRRISGRTKRVLMLAIPLVACIVVFAALGTLRRTMSESPFDDPDTRSMVVKYFTRNTWTAVSLNNLGLATDCYYGTVEYLHGRTYVDYVLSLPPSPISNWLNYVRPLDGPANPARWYNCLMAFGGMHPVVVPFRNFGIWGVLPILFLFGSFICCCEVQNERGCFSTRLLYGCVATASMEWFWYGEMSMIRTLLMWAILLFLDRPRWFHARSLALRNRIPSP